MWLKLISLNRETAPRALLILRFCRTAPSLSITPACRMRLKKRCTDGTAIQTAQGNFSLKRLLLALRANSPLCRPCCLYRTSSVFRFYMWARRYSPTADNPGARLQKNNPVLSELKMNSPHSISIIIPALNEEAAIKDVIEKCKKYAQQIIVMDGHSTDNTRAAAEKAGATVILDNG